MSLRSLPGPVLGNPRSSTIGSGGWLRKIFVRRGSFLAGRFINRVSGEALRLQMSFLTRLWPGLTIQIHGSERRGKKAKDWRRLSHPVELYLFWTVWSRSNIHLVRRKVDCVSLPFRHFCANSLHSTGGFVSLPRAYRLQILPIARARRPCAESWSIYPAMPARS